MESLLPRSPLPPIYPTGASPVGGDNGFTPPVSSHAATLPTLGASTPVPAVVAIGDGSSPFDPNRPICLRHDKNQAKKKCTCGKARRYKQQSRGYKPPAPDAEFEELRDDGIVPVVAALRDFAGDAAVAHWGCLALGNVCYSRKNAEAVKAAGGEERVKAVLEAAPPGDGVVRRAATRALELLNRETYRDEEAKPGSRGSRSPRTPATAPSPASTASLPAAAAAVPHLVKTAPSAVAVEFAAGGYTTVVQAAAPPAFVLPQH